MKVKTLKTIYHDKLGKINPGSVVDLNESQVKMYLERGAVQSYETKVVIEVAEEQSVVEQKPKKPLKKSS